MAAFEWTKNWKGGQNSKVSLGGQKLVDWVGENSKGGYGWVKIQRVDFGE